MDEDRIEGVAQQAKGVVKGAFGKLVGDTRTEAEGAVEEASGKARGAVGSAEEASRTAATE